MPRRPDLRLVIRMFNTGLGYGVKRLFADCAVLSDAAMAAPSAPERRTILVTLRPAGR